MGSEDKELLFCDTFNHDGEEGQLHVDMIKFSPPVLIQEVRVIPLNINAHGNVNLINHMGKTLPSSFNLDVYSNDSANPLAPTFDPLGVVEYQPGTITLEVKPKNSSDQVVVRGLYTVLTLCIYGTVSAPAFPDSPSPHRRSASPFSNSESGLSDSERKEGRGTGEGGSDGKPFELFEPFSPVNSPDHLFDLSDEEILQAKRSTTASGGYEELSDEEVSFDGDFDSQEGVDSYYGEEGWLTSNVGFNPYQCEFLPLETFKIPDTPHEVLLIKLQKTDLGSKRSGTDEASKLRDIILKQRDMNQPLKWVEMLEEIPSYLYPGLAQLQKKSIADGKEVMQKLVKWTLQCLDLETARELPLCLNVRHLKAGMRLIPSIAALGRKCANALIKHGVMEKLCDLVVTDRMASTLKLLSLRAVDTLLDYPQGMERFLGWNKEKEGFAMMRTPYQLILDLLLSEPPPRVCASATSLLKKVHIGELLGQLQDFVDKVVAVTPVKASQTSSDELYDLYSKAGPEGTTEGEYYEGGEKLEPPATDLGTDNKGEEGGGGGGGGSKEVSEASVEVKEEMEEELMGGDEGEMESEDKTGVLPEEEARKIVQCLEELKKCLEQARLEIIQAPIKSFPTSTLHFLESKEEYFSSLVRIMRARRLLECLLILITAPSTLMELGMFAAVQDLLIFFLSTQEGMNFLSSAPDVMNAMARALTQTVDEMPLTAMLPITDFLGGNTESRTPETCTAQNLGLLLTYHLQVLQSLDVLQKASKLNMSELESGECIGALHALYSMTLTPIGKCAFSYVLSLSENVLVLLPFIEPRHQRDHDNKLTKSSVSSRYAALLLLQLLKNSIRLDFLFSCGSKLLSAAEFFKDNSSPLMSDLYNWLSPAKELSSGESSKVIPALVGIIKEKSSSISCNKPGKASAPIMTAIRLLLFYVTPPPFTKGTKKDPQITQSFIHLFSSNSLDTLLLLLNKFSDAVLPVWSQQQSLSVNYASILVSLASFTLQLMRELLKSLLGEEDCQFQDTRVAMTLLRVHMILCSAPYSTVASDAAHEIQMLIVEILSMYTKPQDIIKEGEDKPDISQNCWCLMLKEVFGHTFSSPNCFLSGLMVLSELLPLPLPTHSTHPISRGHLSLQRKLWALHLDPFLSSITELIQTFLLSSANALQQMLRRVCAQLADISAPLATLIIQQVISLILVEIEKQLEREEPETMDTAAGEEGEGKGEENSGGTGGGESQGKDAGGGGGGGGERGEGEGGGKMAEDEQLQKSLNSPLLRNITTCAVLIQQPAIKVALLDLISQPETADTKGFSRFIPLLLFLVQRKETTVQLKLCIMFILNALCNVYIALNTSEVEDVPPSDQQLSNCLPGKLKLEHVTSAVLGHVTSCDQPLATMMLGLKVILSLCQYDVGLLNIYRLIPNHIKGFAFILERLTDTVRSSTPPSTDTISCVSLFLQLLGHLLSSEVTGRAELVGGDKDSQASPGEIDSSSSGSETKRESHYEIKTVSFPRTLLKMIVCNEKGESLLNELRNALEVNCKEDTSLLTEFTKIIATLETEFQGIEPDMSGLIPLEHRVWPPMESVETQFELRTVVTISDNPPSPDYWMASPPHDESELEPDTAARDLNKLASQSCSGLNLEEELKKHLLPSPPRTPPRNDRKRKIALSGPEAQKKLKEAIQQRMLQGPKRDMFRLRKQNTSRPPSMHVDDFMAKSSANRNSSGSRGLSRDHHLGGGSGGSGAGNEHGGPFQYMPQPGGMFMPQMGGRWLGAVPSGLNYPPRRDMSGLGGGQIRSSWDTRGIPPAFLSSQLKTSAAMSRNVSMYSALQAYSRANSGGRGPILWPAGSGRSSSSSSGRQGEGVTSHKSSSNSRHNIYKRLV